MPRQVNFVVLGIVPLQPFAVAAVQYGHRRDNSVVCVSQGDIHPATFPSTVGMLSEWHEAQALAIVDPCPHLSEVDRTADDDPWVSTAPGVRVVYLPAKAAHAALHARGLADLVHHVRGLQYSFGTPHKFKDVVKGGGKAVDHRALAVGAAVACARWMWEGDAATERTGTGEKLRAHS